MNFEYPAEAEAFRGEVRAWLDENLTGDVRGLSVMDADDEQLARLRAWNRTLADARYAAIAWPEEYGGRGAGIMEQVVLAEELHRAGAPGTMNPIGLSNIAPAIIEHGTDEQKRTLLPRMLRGDDVWCQGFSEPDAGSDLASLRTSAVLDGDHFVVNGQKTWNTLGHLADWCELLVRTDPSAPKHKGITCLLVDMTLPGIEVRPLVTITGEPEFNELYFTDVRVPKDALLGPLHDGWRVAMTTLAHERGGVAALHLGLRAKVAQLLALAKTTPTGDGRAAADDPVIRRKLARVYLEAEYLKLLADRAVSGALHGRATGPESSIAKLVWSETEQHVAEVAADVLGPDANRGKWGRDLVYSRAMTIAGGTTQVNKNVLAQRVLGLPRS
ncbi:MAG TPA: acyl-CoA dehydrogenase family protein [Acidimicrobiia bacterium]|nr:acyl-CoA dehydrogenase family protein [Acidimicrobiia bacterium]